MVLVNAKVNWPSGIRLRESLVYSLALVVLALMVGGLALNYILPHFGVARPLDRVPVVVALLTALIGLGFWRISRWRLYDGLSAGSRQSITRVRGRRDQTVLVVGAILIVGSVAGPIRLNNGAGGFVATATLVLGAVMIVGVFRWRQSLYESTVLLALYALSLSLLLMTSLRGWFVTGHDVQREFRLFELASGQGIWNVDSLRSAYNACLSITILPTIVERVTGIPDLYIFKVVFQALFALCPVLIYLIARRFSSKSVALLAAVYFVAYPTYFGDMPFMNRQEIAFFFLGTAILVMTNGSVPVRTRRIGFAVFGAGVVLAHYSTAYVMLGIIAVCWIVTRVMPIVLRLSRTRKGRHGVRRPRPEWLGNPRHLVLTWTVIVFLAVLASLWAGPITGAGGQFERTFRSAFDSLTSAADGGQRSSDASYAVIGGPKQSAEKRLRAFRRKAVEDTAQDRAAGATYDLTELDRYATPVVTPAELPETAIGEVVGDVGVDASTINRLLRSVAPVWLQLCVALGLVAVVVRRAHRCTPNFEFVAAAFACIAVIALQVLLPDLSVDYGILRTFAESLFWLAPFLAFGSIYALSWLGRSKSAGLALGVAVGFYLSLTGVIPKLLGGYPPQLHLNNSGEYYDNCYLHAQEATAMKWLQGRIGSEHSPDVQSHAFCYIYAFTASQRYGEPSDGDDIFPVLLRKDAYVFLGYTTVRKDEVALSYAGDIVTYQYPVSFLDKRKSLIYSSNGARIYR
ncbi:MAG: DUF2206 domain-containing protein [Mycobacterium sp.]